MKRKLLLAVAVLAIPGLVHALGLGKLQLNSSLNQAFDARIELLSATASELDNLNVGLADTEAFKRAGIDRPYVLSKLKFEVVETENGSDYIKITSRDAIREPFLNFLLEASWSNGRLYREYTVLLDPPLYDPGTSSRASSSDTYDSPSTAVDYDSDPVSSDDSSPVYSSSEPSYSGNEYGPTDTSDTLWSIASQVRPDSSVSVQQMMMALLRANPDAFINGNINGLKRGQILTIPSADEIDSLSSQEAISEVSAQNSSWGGGIADPVERADSMSVSDADDMDVMSEDSDAEMISDDESELRLVAASSDGAAAGGVGGDSAGGADVALVSEELQAVKQENAELRDRNQEAETIIQDLKRLIELKDNELATLQQQMAGGEVADEMAAVDTMEADAMVEDEMEVAEEMVDAVEEEISDGEEMVEDIMTDEGMMDDTEVIEEELVDEEYDVVEEDMEVVEDDMEVVEEDMEVVEEEGEEMVAEPAVEQAAAPASPAPAQDEPKGIVDQAIAFVMDYLFIIIGAIGAVIVVFMGLLFVSRRKQSAAAEADTEINTTEFPDFEEDAAAETEAPVADAEMESTAEGSEAETMQPEGDMGDEEEGDKTQFVAPDAAEEPAAAEEAAPAAPEEPEEEPLAEVNVLIAYEQFDQAEEFVRDAIAGNPDNVEFHAKLLEVFYAANDRKKYEEAAQVLHDKVNGEGPHWDMAQAMWQEMSPSRGLFEEGADEEPAEAPAAEAGGIMDITADDEEAADAGVDFDLGMEGAAEEEAAASDSSEEVLDLTADGEDDDISVLDVTTAARVDASTSDEDLLDVTAAVGLEPETTGTGEDTSGAGDEEPVLDVTGGDDEDLLDITGGADDIAAEEPAQEEDVLDISHGGGEDLLDVTANANLEPEGLEEDLLDVTSSVGAEADGEELQEVAEEDAGESDDNSLDFDIGGMGGDEQAADETADSEAGEADDEDSNLIDFDSGGESDGEISLDAPGLEEAAAEEEALDISVDDSAADDSLDMDIEAPAEEEVSLDLDVEAPAEEEVSLDMDVETPAEEEVSLDMDMEVPAEAEGEDGGVELDLSMDDAADDESAADADLDLSIDDDDGDAPEISLDSEAADDDLAIDLSIDDDTADEAPAADLEIDSGGDDDLEIDLTIDDDGDADTSGGDSAAADDIELDMDFDLEIEDDSNDGMDIDMDGTVEMPKLDVADTGIEIDEDDDDDDDEDQTVFVPRSGSTDEQSAEDEVATKLDLAKAYVELGDKDSAKGILDEVMSEGNDEQKQTAQDLLNQLG